MISSAASNRFLTDESGGFVIWWLLGLSGVAILMFALVADGSRVMAGLNDTSDVAQVAARAGARMVNPSTGSLDATRAAAAAQTELAATGMTGTVTVNGNEIAVTASATIDLPLLAIVGVDQHTVDSTRTARAISGP
jgi:Flp pilus assembly protein TadG